MGKTKKITISIALVATVLLSTLFAFSGATTFGSTSMQTYSSVAPAATGITGVISAVESGTTSTSNWSIGPIPNVIGSTINVDVRIDQATPLTIWSWFFNLNWTASVFQLTKVKEGNFLKDGDSIH